MTWFDSFSQTDGILAPEEGAMLHSLIFAAQRYCPGLPAVELGTAHGKSAVAIGSACAELGTRLYTFDTFGVEGMSAERARANLAAAGVAGSVIVTTADSAGAGRSWGRGPICLLFIDAGHDYGSVSADIGAWWPHLSDGGYMALHDVQFPGVWRAQIEFYRREWKIVHPVAETRTMGVFQKVPR